MARDIQITANWGHTDLETISRNVHGGGGFSIGPFRLSGGGGSSSSSTRVNSTFDGKTITAPGLQVFAWVHQVHFPGIEVVDLSRDGATSERGRGLLARPDGQKLLDAGHHALRQAAWRALLEQGP